MIKFKLNFFLKKYCFKKNKIKPTKRNCKLIKFNNRIKLKNKYIKSISKIVKNIRILNIF